MVFVVQVVQVEKLCWLWLDEFVLMFDQLKFLQCIDVVLLFGVVDQLECQEQVLFYFLFDIEGYMVIYGISGLGKSVVLCIFVVLVGIILCGGFVQVYGFDFGFGVLCMLELLLYVGLVIFGDDVEWVVCLFVMLCSEFDWCGDVYFVVGVVMFIEYWVLLGKFDELCIVVFIDGFVVFCNDYEVVIGCMDIYNVLQEVFLDGCVVGIYVVLFVDWFQSILSVLNVMLQCWVVLCMVDIDVYNIFNVFKDVLILEFVFGWVIVGENEVQIVIIGGMCSMKEQLLVIEWMVVLMLCCGVFDVFLVWVLLFSYCLDDVLVMIGDQFVVGLLDVDFGFFGIELIGIFVIVGLFVSGKSNVFVVIMQQVFWVCFDMLMFFFGFIWLFVCYVVLWIVIVVDGISGIVVVVVIVEKVEQGLKLVVVVEGVVEFVLLLLEMLLLDFVK